MSTRAIHHTDGANRLQPEFNRAGRMAHPCLEIGAAFSRHRGVGPAPQRPYTSRRNPAVMPISSGPDTPMRWSA
jgi:hypothetical protein